MGEIIGEVIIFTVLNFIGGTIRWFFVTIWKSIFNIPKEKRSFKDYLYDSEEDAFTNDGANGCLNILIGIAFVICVIFVILNI